MQLPTYHAPETLTQTEARVAWSLIAEPGDYKVNRWIDAYDGDAVAALAAVLSGVMDRQPDLNVEELVDAPTAWRARWSPGRLQIAVQQMARFGIATIIPGETVWPAQLDLLDDLTPYILYTRGDVALLQTRMVAVVGARAATGYGEHVTMELCAALVDKAQVTIVSGAAFGIDGMAHRATLASHGRTVAVLAGGVDKFYPSGHDALLTKVAEAGLVVSELPPGQPPTKWRFLQRNRIIAALSEVVVVVEAGYRSGSLNTANHATEIGIPVAAVPGPVTSAASAGCHQLIAAGSARLVTGADDVLAIINPAEEPA